MIKWEKEFEKFGDTNVPSDKKDAIAEKIRFMIDDMFLPVKTRSTSYTFGAGLLLCVGKMLF